MSEQVFTYVYDGRDNQRLDKFLVSQMGDFTRSRLQALIRDGQVSVDGNVVSKSGAAIENGQSITVRVPPTAPTDLVPESIPLEIIFENEDLMIINKPAGMVVHPAIGHSSGTLVHAALAHAPSMEGIGGQQRPGVVHRLDKDTSGLILMAKNDKAHQWLQNQFRTRKVKKVYFALVDGKPPTPKGRVEAPIGRDPSHRKKMAIVPLQKGREAISEYGTLEVFPSHTLLEFYPLTGRTHQVRLHCAFLECPIVADTIYGHRHSTLPLNRHFLHAARISIILPGEQEVKTFEAPLPTDLQNVIDGLRAVR